MNKSIRKAVIAGNWKMNKPRPEAKTLLDELKPLVAGTSGVDIVVCVPYTDLGTAIVATKDTNIKVGAQNVHFEKAGAFTGEISADMLKELGVQYVIIGHSERRQFFGETDETVNKRTTAALDAGLTPIVCVGELLWERETDITDEVVSRQIKLAFYNVPAEQAKKQSSRTNLSGQSAPVVPPQPNRRRRLVCLSETCFPDCTARRFRML